MLKLLHKFNCLMGRHVCCVTKRSRLSDNYQASCIHCDKAFLVTKTSFVKWEPKFDEMSEMFKWHHV